MLDGKLDDWKYDVVSIGFPAPVRNGRILTDPKNLGKGGRDSILKEPLANRCVS